MNIFRQLAQKPWLDLGDNVVDIKQAGVIPTPPAKIGLFWLLASIAVVFSLISIGYSYRLTLPDWKPLPDPSLLWLNTAILLFGSIYLENARKLARQGQIKQSKTKLIIAGVLTVLFLIGQFWVSNELASMGYYAAANPANAFFYLITWLHALHLFGGLVAWVRAVRMINRSNNANKIALSLELCAIYWHFLFLVWLILFILMLFS